GKSPLLGGEGGMDDWGLGEGGVGEEPSGEEGSAPASERLDRLIQDGFQTLSDARSTVCCALGEALTPLRW
ncbi:hypothetical protein, partial [Sinorhizobium meliloti]|uniref:hypothetical protein n=1 Tax=Rhizobium meliloti TaxID=382 RepID=UPI001AECA643